MRARDSKKELKKWMIDNDVRVVDIARELGCSKTLVWLTLFGEGRSKKNNRKVISWMRNKGCPYPIDSRRK